MRDAGAGDFMSQTFSSTPSGRVPRFWARRSVGTVTRRLTPSTLAGTGRLGVCTTGVAGSSVSGIRDRRRRMTEEDTHDGSRDQLLGRADRHGLDHGGGVDLV